MPGGQAQTPSYLQNTLLASGQATGAITPTRMQDIPASFAPWDDPANVQGLGPPGILRGTVNAAFSAGVTVGSGQTTAVRQATFTGLQNAINIAASQDKFFELPPGTYEISGSAGLVIPASTGTGFVWRGSKISNIVQYYNTGSGAPILTIGDSTTASVVGNLDFDGVQLYYGASVSGLTLANALVIGPMDWGKVENVVIGINNAGTQLNPAYRAIYIPNNNFAAPGSGTNPASFFSNKMSGIVVYGFQVDALSIYNNSTGSVWDNIYLSGGAGSGAWPSVSGNFINMQASGLETSFEQVNCEWVSTNVAINLGGLYGTYFRHLHMEGIKFTGSNGYLINSANDAITVDMLSLVDCQFSTVNSMSGTGFIFNEYFPGQGCNRINKMVITANSANEVNLPVVICNMNNGPPADSASTFVLQDLKINDSGGNNWFTGHLSMDNINMPVGAGQYLAPYCATSYRFGIASSVLEGACINVSTNYTHYGNLVDAEIFVPASITGFTITLSSLMRAGGTSFLCKWGNTVTIRRESGSASGTLLVKDSAASPNTLTTNTTSGQNFIYQFIGGTYAVPLWIAVT